ncbi:hypothetical protein [Streptomyces scabichelini]|uniref:hypothetical protein n=1 Tax=Streptomyces scabichelini TaxID=2711217 RepID=UPI001F49F4AC|nr:hypothetical protein [Streptomyces scabichelini]
MITMVPGRESAEEDQPFGEFVGKPPGEVGVDLQLLDEGEAVVLVAGPGDPFSQLRCEAGQGGKNRDRYVIDVDEAAVIELPWEIRSTDPQLACEGGITIEDASRFGPPLPTFVGPRQRPDPHLPDARRLGWRSAAQRAAAES